VAAVQPAAVPVQSAKRLFFDDLVRDPLVGAPTGWVADGGLLSAGSTWTDYAVSADVTPSLLSLGGDMGVAGRFVDANDYYGCGIHDGTSLELWRVWHGERQVLDSRLVPTAGLTGSHAIRLGLRGNQLDCSMDGGAALHAADGSIASGRLALVAQNGQASGYDRVEADSLP
jgi:hypothetical protein